MHLFRQNLSTDTPGREHWPMIVHGRASLSTKDSYRRVLSLEWTMFLTTSCALTLRFDRDEREVRLHAAFPFLFSLFIGIPLSRWLVARLPWKHERGEYDYAGGDRALGIEIHNGAVWLSFWNDVMESRPIRDPWWYSVRVGLDDVADLVFGRDRAVITVLEAREVVVRMPEGPYRGFGKLELMEKPRPRLPRWLTPRWRTVELDFQARPIPVPGKGENSWDCDEDAVYKTNLPIGKGEVIEDVVRRFEAKHLAERARRGGAGWRPEARPA